MIRVSPGVSLSAGFAPAQDARTPAAQHEGGSFEDALGGIESPPQQHRLKESARPEPKPERDDEDPQPLSAHDPVAERAIETTDNTERTVPAQDVEGAPDEGAQRMDTETAESAEEAHPGEKTEAVPARIIGGAGDGGAKGEVAIAPGAKVVASPGPVRPGPTPPEAIKPHGEQVGGAPAPETEIPKGEPLPKGGSPDEPESKTAPGKVRPKRVDILLGREWPKHIAEPRLNERRTPTMDIEHGVEAGPGGGITVGPVSGERFPIARAQDAPVAPDMRTGPSDATDARTPVVQPAGQSTGNESEPKGDGAPNQWQAQRGAAVRSPERAEGQSPKPEVGGVRMEESAPAPTARTGAELVGAMGLGRALGAPKGAPGSAGSTPQGEKAGGGGGLEGAVTRGFSAVMRQNGGSVVIRLSPESLGPVRIGMSVEGSSVSVMLEAGTAKAHELLSQSLGSLRQSLEAQGLRVERMGVTLSPPHQASSGPVTDGSMHQRGSEDSGFGDQDAADGRSRGHADQESRDRHGGARADPTHPLGTFSELVESSGTSLRFVATA